MMLHILELINYCNISINYKLNFKYDHIFMKLATSIYMIVEVNLNKSFVKSIINNFLRTI